MTKKLTQLGRAVAPPSSPDKAKLESVPNPHPDADYVVRFTAPEFTTLCPITGQPDFAHFVIDYVPDKTIVESKSLKLFLTSFRYLRIAGYWYPRGGMPIDIFWQTGRLPKDVWLPDTGVSPYRGRG